MDLHLLLPSWVIHATYVVITVSPPYISISADIPFVPHSFPHLISICLYNFSFNVTLFLSFLQLTSFMPMDVTVAFPVFLILSYSSLDQNISSFFELFFLSTFFCYHLISPLLYHIPFFSYLVKKHLFLFMHLTRLST